MKKRIFGLLLALVMMLSLVPTTVLASIIVASGKCGSNLTWTLDDAGMLTISGTGSMEEYGDNCPPWYGESISEVKIGNGVTSIAKNAFSDCYDLTSVTIPSSMISIGDQAFMNCPCLTNVTIPDNVASIGHGAFSYCADLTSVSIPDSVTSIGDSAFQECENLTSVKIGNSVTNIGEFAFYNCRNLKSVTISDSVTSIGEAAFENCEKLTSVTIPDSVTTISSSAFLDCSTLSRIVVSSTNTTYSSDSKGVLFDKKKTELILCPEGYSGAYTIPNSVTSIGESAFYKCKNLTSVSIPDSVTSIGRGAFDYCENLTSVTLPNSVTNIGGGAFIGCSKLESVTISDKVTSVEYSTFLQCSNLSSVTIPSSVTSIGYSAFGRCNNLSDVYYGGTKTQWNAVAVNDGNESLKKATIHYGYVLSPELTVMNTASTGKPKLTWKAVSGAAQYEVYRATSKTGTYSKLTSTTNLYLNNTSAEVGSTYYYKVRALNSAGTASEYSNIVYTTCDCAKPMATVAANSSGKPYLSWKSVDGATGYEVYCATSETGTYTMLYTTSNLYLNHNSAIEGKTYYYKVVALSSKSNDASSAFSDVVNFTCKTVKPTAPVISISNVAATGKPQLNWVKVTGAAKYEVYRAASKDGSYTKMYTTTGTSYSNSTAVVGNTYYYKVCAISASGERSGYSAVQYITCGCPKPMVSATANNSGKPYLSWAKVDGATGYEVYYATSKTGTYSKLYTTSNLYLNHNSAAEGTTYYYKVVALSSKSNDATSAYSDVVSFTCKIVKMVAPTISVSNAAATGKPQLSWGKVDGAVKYEVYRAASKDGSYTKMYTTTGTSYSNSTAVVGNTYYYKVCAISASGVRSGYSAVKYITCDCAKPMVSATANSNSKPYLSWAKVDGATSYEIYYATSANGTYTKLYTASNLYLNHNSAKAGTTYYYKVLALSSKSSYATSAYSDVVSIKAR